MIKIFITAKESLTIISYPRGPQSLLNFKREKDLPRSPVLSWFYWKLGRPLTFGFLLILTYFCTSFGWTQTNGTSNLTVASKAATTDTSDDLTLSPQEEIQVLDAIDSGSNSSAANSTTQIGSANPLDNPAGQAPASVLGTPTPYVPPPAPTGLNILMLKEGVHVSWAPASANTHVTAYNVYRSTTPGGGYHLINVKPIVEPYFLDGVPTSLAPPKNGEDYFYVVASIDPQGNVSPYSDEIAITPQGMEIPLTAEEKKATEKPTPTPGPEEEKEIKIPENNIVNLQLPADSQLSIQGYKKIEAQFSFQKYNRPDLVNGISSSVNTTTVSQELTVSLKGKVGKNVDVNVDYSDVNRAGGVDQSKQEISIVYHGNEDSAIQEVAFGDLQLNLPNTEFAGFSKQLFGLQAKLKFDRFRFTSFFAQTKGISETKVFKGNFVQVDKTIQDIEYIRQKYFLITKQFLPGNPPSVNGVVINYALPLNNSEQIWVNAGNGQVNPIGPNFNGSFARYLPGRDYTIDYSTGVITFLVTPPTTAQIAVAFIQKDGTPVGFTPGASTTGPNTIDLVNGLAVDPQGNVQDKANLIKDNINPAAVSPLYLVNYFSLGTDKIVPPQQDPDFLFQVIEQGTNNVIQTGQGSANFVQGLPVPTPIPSSPSWFYLMNQDLNLLIVDNLSNTGFPERAFANPDGGVNSSNQGVYNQTVAPTSLDRIHLRYKSKLDFFRLDRFNIIRGSESVYLDGRRLRRDVDYFFDYTSGFLDFQDKSILRTDSQVVVTYEYAPFGSFNQNNILGARAEYDVTDHFFLGSTFLYSTSQQPVEVPQVGSTPNSLAVLDADARYDISSEDIQSLTGIIPGLEGWKPPFNIKLSGEVAQSYFNPDTFNAEGETGVAMVDNMEGIDSVTGVSMSQTSWLVSSVPQPVGFLGGNSYDAGPNASNNRIRFFNENNNLDFLTAPATQTSLPGYGGHVFANTNDAHDQVSVLQFPYSHLTNQRWGGLRQVISTTGADFTNVRYFQTWVYNDGGDKWMMFDFGVLNEDSNGNNVFDEDVTIQNGTTIPNQANPNPLYGIPTFYFPGNPYSGTGGLSTTPFAPPTTNVPSQEGFYDNNVYITEDMNGNQLLDTTDSYFEYGIRANWSGWRLVKIPVNLAAPDSSNSTPDGISYFFHSQGAPSPQIIRSVRLWITGTTASEQNGYFLAESINFSQNLWQLQVDPDANVNQGVTVNTAKFDSNSISQDQDSRYSPTLRFLTVTTGQDQNAISFKEKALKITYNLSSADFEPAGNIGGKPIYYATRLFNQGVDFTDYQEMRFDLQAKTFSPGDILFVRVGNDQKDFYQYNFPLTSSYQNLWNTVTIALDGSGGNRLAVGTPFINRAVQISIGVLSPNPPSAITGELWVNNLRLVTPSVRSGLARRLNAAIIFGDNFATVNARYREVDSGFTQLDQTSTHFQHSTQVGADYSSSGVKLFAQPLVTQFSITQQDLYTEDVLSQNPYYLSLPNVKTNNATGSISYTKDLGANLGRLTNLRVSGTTNYEADTYEPVYLNQPGVQGNIQKTNDNVAVASTYDAPAKLFFVPIGSNQFNQTFTLTHDTQQFDSAAFSPYERTTRVQTYGWTNTTEIVKNLVFTPGYTWSLTDAVGNTSSPGIPSGVPDFTPFQQRYQPKAGIVYRGIPGITPGIDYSGSNQYDFVTFADGLRFNNANNLNYSLNLTPGTWIPLAQQINLTVFGGRTESGTESIPSFNTAKALNFDDLWGTNPRFDIALTATKSVAHQLNASFKLFDTWDFRPTGSWTDQKSLLSQGSNPVQQIGRTLGLTTIYNKKIFTVPFIAFSLDSAQFQYTRTDNTQYDSESSANIATASSSDLFALTFPYDINQKAQGNIRLQRTIGYTNTSGTETFQHDDLGTIEYNQKFLENTTIHIPFTKWKIKFDQALEFHATFSMEFIQNNSTYVFNQAQSEKVRGTIDLNYNALKNLRIGLGVAYENFTNDLNPTLGYDLWQGTISAEARF